MRRHGALDAVTLEEVGDVTALAWSADSQSLAYIARPAGVGCTLWRVDLRNASRRALAWIQTNGIVNQREYGFAKDALWWAAMTYVVAALGSLATLLYYASLLLGGRRSD